MLSTNSKFRPMLYISHSSSFLTGPILTQTLATSWGSKLARNWLKLILNTLILTQQLQQVQHRSLYHDFISYDPSYESLAHHLIPGILLTPLNMSSSVEKSICDITYTAEEHKIKYHIFKKCVCHRAKIDA